MVGLSFIRDRDSVRALYRRLEGVRKDLGVVLKIETAAAFADFPGLAEVQEEWVNTAAPRASSETPADWRVRALQRPASELATFGSLA
jgi:hypothetical protein